MKPRTMRNVHVMAALYHMYCHSAWVNLDGHSGRGSENRRLVLRKVSEANEMSPCFKILVSQVEKCSHPCRTGGPLKVEGQEIFSELVECQLLPRLLG